MLSMDGRWCLVYAIVGYLAGGILFCDLLLRGLKQVDVFRAADDGNPGTHNAFQLGGLWCGLGTLLGDLAKGFFPVWLCLRRVSGLSPLLSLTLLAPVLGHAFPLGRRGRGGKAIAVSFGALLGLLPRRRPLLLLAACYLFFSLIAVIRPHDVRSITTYLTFAFLCLLLVPEAPLRTGCCLISGVVVYKHLIPILKRQVKAHEQEGIDPIL